MTRLTLVTFAALTLLASALGCKDGATETKETKETKVTTAKAPAVPSWLAPHEVSAGEYTARCIDETLHFAYAAQKQEYGDPWKEPDTFTFFDADTEGLRVAFLGSASTVDGAKTRLEARLPLVKAAVARCEKLVGLTVSADALVLSYSQVNRGTGTLKDVLIWQAGKFDFPKAAAPNTALEWIGAMK